MLPEHALYQHASVAEATDALGRSGGHGLLAAAIVVATYTLAQGALLVVERRGGQFFDAWAVIPMAEGSPGINASLLDCELDQYGLVLMSEEECPPELTSDGLKVWVAFRDGGEE